MSSSYKQHDKRQEAPSIPLYKPYQDPFCGSQPWKLNWLRMILTWKGGSVWSFFLLEWLAAIAFCALLTTILYISRRDLEESVRQSLTRGLTDAVVFLARRFQAAMALMLGFYTIQCFGRWTTARNLQGVVMGKLRDLSFQVAWRLLPRQRGSSGSEEKVTEDNIPKTIVADEEEGIPAVTRESVALLLVRWFNLSHALVIGNVYERTDHEFAAIDRLVENGMATAYEASTLKEKPIRVQHIAPMIWATDLLQELAAREEEGENCGVTSGIVTALTGGMSALISSLSEIYNHHDSPLPLSYRQLVNTSVRLYLIFLLLAAALVETSIPPLGQLDDGSFWIILAYAFEYLLFVGWVVVADAIHNPYRDWPGSYPWHAFVKAAAINSVSIATSLHAPVSIVPERQEKEVTASFRAETAWKAHIRQWARSNSNHKQKDN